MSVVRLAGLLVLAVITAACGVGGDASRPTAAAPTFPVVDRAPLSDVQRGVVDQLQAEFGRAQPGSAYAEGVDEQWCADFVSWIMKTVGSPLTNPNSGHWRIPGVYTMQEYYQSVGRWERYGYRPVVGDVVLWNDGSPFNLHVNVVVGVRDADGADGLKLTTVGGNEEGGIQAHTTPVDAATPLLGYGRLR